MCQQVCQQWMLFTRVQGSGKELECQEQAMSSSSCASKLADSGCCLEADVWVLSSSPSSVSNDEPGVHAHLHV
jgi:hypothetical protein